jgi:dihydroxy-acid dehydratase
VTVLTPFDRSTDAPARKPGGFAILHGTFAPQGCVARLDGFELDVYDGPARVFSTAGDALEAIAKGRIREGDILILRNDARDANPFSTEGVEQISAALKASGIERVTLLTDGRTGSQAPEIHKSGAMIGSIAPSAQAGGPIAYVNDDDIIHIDIAGRRIDILADIDLRRGAKRKKTTAFGALDKYAAMVSAANGH